MSSAARSRAHLSLGSLGDTPLDAELIADVAQVYLAPETDQEFADPVDLDVFGIGSLAYPLGDEQVVKRSSSPWRGG
ncbi:hypothetical protein [Streptomyces sp. 6N223]|uniref:hypothetical protein n=1 Tax=Streptomyces sp. 6N223 TaxID=3457412 RepID=UPI003FD1DE76